MEFITLIVLATLGEAVWETLKMVWQEGKASIDKIGALMVALVITLGTRIDIMPMLGLSMEWGILGAILTAILISRGATFVHELISKISNIKDETIINKSAIQKITDGSIISTVSETTTVLDDSGLTIKNGELLVSEFKDNIRGNTTTLNKEDITVKSDELIVKGNMVNQEQ